MATHIIRNNRDRFNWNTSLLEDAARASLDAISGGTLTNETWERSRSRLQEFMGLLLAWDRVGERKEPGELIVFRKAEP